MTANQLQWLANQETIRANQERERENRRANLAKELETKRSNLRSEAIKSYEAETGRRKQEREAEHMQIQELNDTLKTWTGGLSGLVGLL